MVRPPGARAVPPVHPDRAERGPPAGGVRDRPGGGRLSPAIALLGPRCAGKSAVGHLLAERLGRPFRDSDEELARRFGGGRSAGELLAELGEPAFRLLEWRTLAALLLDQGAEPSVIATGGGAPTFALSRELLGRRAVGVLLRARPETLRVRAAADPTPRPPLGGGARALSVERLLELREPLYRSLAKVVVDTDDESPDEIASRIEVELRRRADFGRR